MEQKFVEEFCHLMRLADFSAISRGEWDMANEDAFMFNLPVNVLWKSYDTELLGAYPSMPHSICTVGHRCGNKQVMKLRTAEP